MLIKSSHFFLFLSFSFFFLFRLKLNRGLNFGHPRWNVKVWWQVFSNGCRERTGNRWDDMNTWPYIWLTLVSIYEPSLSIKNEKTLTKKKEPSICLESLGTGRTNCTCYVSLSFSTLLSPPHNCYGQLSFGLHKLCS